MGLGRFEGRFRSCQDHFTWKIAVDKVIGMYNNASMASWGGYPWFGIVFEAFGFAKGG